MGSQTFSMAAPSRGNHRAVTPLRICGNLQQRGLPLWIAKPLRQTGISADLVKTRVILTVTQKI